ncbi:MAG: hypothetical protein HY397_03690 [Candidatus Doudnabacteria bacterium]|nr:hypothetical protein [Candidatus Doudnabacteria bacterium]
MLDGMNSWPLLVYFYDAQGRHAEPVPVNDLPQLEALMRGEIKRAIRQHLEVMVTDGDNVAVFHSQHGRIIFPTSDDLAGVFG